MTSSADGVLLGERYRLEKRIGAGSMGTVWRATDERLGRTVAVKQLLLQPGAPGFDTRGPEYEEARQRMLREGRLAARLHHANTVGVFDVVLHDDVPWLVMEYLESRTLGGLLAAEGTLEPRRAAEIGCQVADGLAAAHAAGIVHRDIKPGNILIGMDGTVKITDFGVSRAADDVQLTRTGLIAGTPAFLAPEVARGQTPVPASDVFALGSSIYACMEGTPPFGLDDNAYAMLYLVGGGEVRPPTQAGPLTGTLMWMLHKEPERRPTAAQARDELAAVAAGRQPSRREPPLDAGVSGNGPPTVGATPTPVGAPPPAVPATKAPRPAGTRVDLSPAPSAEPWRPPIDPEPAGRSGRIALWVVIALGATVLLAAVAFAVARPGSQPPQPASPPVAEPAPSAIPPSPDPPSTASPSDTPPADGANQPSGEAMEDFVRRYYELLPDDTEQAWALLGPQARRQSGSYESYQRFYDGLAKVSFAEEPSATGDRTVRAALVFESKDGRKNGPEPYTFVVEAGPDGELIMSSFSRD